MAHSYSKIVTLPVKLGLSESLPHNSIVDFQNRSIRNSKEQCTSCGEMRYWSQSLVVNVDVYATHFTKNLKKYFESEILCNEPGHTS